jgi:hypothetical protein
VREYRSATHAPLMVESIGLFAAILIFILVIALTTRFRETRNEVLERWIAMGKCGPVRSFEGTLAVEQTSPGFLRLASTEETRRLQFKYRWFSAIREQASYDEVVFDASRHVVELRHKDKRTSLPFGRFSAVRMREIWQQEAGSLWHFDLVALEGRNVLFLSSARGDRRRMFENSAGLARAISGISALPVQVVVSGNVWTPGWPPRTADEY